MQVGASVLIISGFILPFTSFEVYEEQSGREEVEGGLTEVHRNLGIFLISLLSAHLLLTLIRPKPDAPKRWIWNYAHWWAGRLLWLLALVNVCIGITLWRRVTSGSGAEWIVPLVLLVVGYIVLHVYLTRRGRLEAYGDQHLNISGQSSAELAQVSWRVCVCGR